MPDKKGRWMQTFTRKAVYPLDLEPDDICLEDIAHSLSLQCRFNGHCIRFYSVCDHSIHVYRYLVRQYMDLAIKDDMEQQTHWMKLVRWGLLHDAAETYTKDLPRPIKAALPEWKPIEEAIEKVIAAKYELPYPIPKIVRHADDVILATEKRDVMGGVPPKSWEPLPEPLSMIILPLSPLEAEREFLRIANLLDLE